MHLPYIASLLALAALAKATPALSTTLSASGSASLDIPIPVTTAPPSSWVTSVISSSSSSAFLSSNETTTGGGGNSTSTKKTRKPHTEPIPIFTSQCACAEIGSGGYPCWATDALQRCEFEELHSYTCNMINRGCPTPTRKCRDFFTATPVTGRHPCDIGFGNPPAAATLTTDSEAAPIVQPTIVEPGVIATVVARAAL